MYTWEDIAAVADMKAELCNSAPATGSCSWLYGSLGHDPYLYLPHLSCQECCEVSCVQTYVGAEHYKLRMALTKFSADLFVSFNLSASFQCQGNVALQRGNPGAHSCRAGKVLSLTQTMRTHLYSKRLENGGQIFTYSEE